MRKLIFTLILFSMLFQQNAFAQLPTQSISGKLISGDSKQAVESVNIQLFNANDSSLVTGIVSDKQGAFVFTQVAVGDYFIQMSCVGFDQKMIQSVSVNKSSPVNLGTCEFTVANIALDDVSVVYQKSIQENSIDRKVYNVEKDIMSQSGSASNILENIPSVSVDVDGTVSLRGSTNVTFFVNGRPSALLKNNSAVALQQIPANTLERIEVITNPSAKYKPDGTGGIINLVLKKYKKQGFNGTVMANAGNKGRYNMNATLNYNTGKMNIFGSYGFRRNNNPRTSQDSRINRDSMLNVINYYESSSVAVAHPVSHLVNAGFEYQFNDKNKLEISGNANFQNQHRTQNTLSTWKNPEHVITSEYNTFRLNNESEMEWETSTVFTHQFEKEGHELQFELNVTGYDETEDNHYTDTYSIPAGQEDLTRVLIKKGGPLAEFHAEYTLPLGEETELEAGYVGEFFKDNITYLGENFDETSGQCITDRNKSNDFVFHQNTHALYTTVSHSMDKLSFMAGLRAEQVFITSDLLTLDSVVPNNYFRIYPTLHLAYDINEEQQFQLNYSHRVRRPGSDEMNPFPEYSDPRNMEAGNPLAKPEQIHSIEFGYSIKKEAFTIQPTLYYRYKYDGFAEIQKYVNDTVLLRTFENLAKDQFMGMEFIASLNVGKLMTLNLSTNAYYQKIDASNIGYSASKSAYTLDTKLGANVNITKSTMLQVYGYHRTARITAQGHSNPFYYVNMGLRQDLFKNKASLIFTVSDMFNTLKSEFITDTPNLYRKSVSVRDTQIIYFGFTYRFGKSDKKQATELKFDNSI